MLFYSNLICQVTGRILDPFWEKPKTLTIPDIEAFPLLDSSARSPKFQFRYTVKTPHGGITGEAMLLLRIYTLDVNSGELIVFGNSIIRVFIGKENDEVHILNFELMLIDTQVTSGRKVPMKPWAATAVTSQDTRTPDWPIQPATKPRVPQARRFSGTHHTQAR